MALLGGVKIRLTEKLGIDDAQMGRLFSIWGLTNLVFVIVAGVLCDVLGFRAVAIAGYLIGAVAILMFGQIKRYQAAIVGCVLLGIGGMLMNSVGNTLIVDPDILYADAGRSQNLGNTFFGVGALITPLLVAWLLRKMDNLIVLAVILLIPLVFAFMAGFPQAGEGFSFGQAAALLGQSQIILGALGLMCYIALEVSMGGWISTYATSLGASAGKANGILSSYWVGLMLGRLVTALFIAGTFIQLDVQGMWFVVGLAIVAAVIAFLMSTTRKLGTGMVLVALIGLIFGPIFPTIVGLTLSRTDGNLHGTGFGLIFAVGLIGAIFLPAWMGAISKGKDIHASMKVASGTAVVLVLIALIMGFVLGPPLAA
jgi:fucose permease